MRHHGYVAVALAGIAGATGWVLSQSAIVDASENEVTSFREALTSSEEPVRAEPDSSGMQLNYFDARWNRVLGDLAKHSELTLVMDRVPPGRFARRDRTRYSSKDCIRILNRELEGLGYRLLRQGNYLIVLNLDNARTRYARPVVDTEATDPAHQSSASNGNNPFMTASDRHEAKSRSATNVAFDSRAEPPRRRKATTTIPIHTAAFQSTADSEEQQNAPATQPVTRVVDIEHSSAGQVARSVYLVFERRADLVRQGILNLPTFTVYDTNDTDKTGEPLFQIGIDQQNNALIVESDSGRADHLVKLLQRLDKPQQQKESGESAKLLESENMTEETVEEMNDQLQHLVAMRRQQGGNDDVPMEAPNDSDPDVSDTSAFNLRGDVNIQAMQELGVLMIEGNEEDLERLSPIIQRLEQMSVGSLPDIHVLELNHVNSEAFTELLNEVYERLAELRQRGEEERQSVAFFPIVQPNSVLILAPKLELPAILELAEQLDTRLPEDAEFRVFELQHAIAAQVNTALSSFYEDRPGLRTRIRTIPDIRTNSIIVQGHPRDLTEVARLIEGLDRDTPGAAHQVEIFPLSHATASELAEVLSGAIQAVTSPPQTAGGAGGGFGGNQGPQELRDTKSIALEFLSTNGDAQELIRSGFLVDVRINPDPRSNALIVSAPDATMNLLRALITTLDQPPSAIASIKVFALQNADAEQSVELLTTMFENTNQEEQLGVQIAGAEDASSSLIPLQFTADIRTNTVLAVGSSEALSIVEAILLRLDTDDTRQRTTTVIELRNARAEDVEESINTFLDQQQALQDSSEDLVSNIERLRQEAIVAADPGSNSVIISASPEYFSRITQIISELDSSKPQVVIQALLVEVQLDNTDEFGVELGFQDPLLFQRSIVESLDDLITIPTSTLVPGVGTVQSTTIVTQNSTPGFNFNNTGAPLGNNATGDTGAIGNQGISSFSLGRQNGDLGFGGFVFSAQSDAVNVLIRALAARRTLHVLSRPQIRATHNNLATIQVGQEVPRVDGVVIDEGIVSPQVTIENTGIILEVTPRITPDNSVVMEVLAEKSALNAGGVPVFTDVNTGNTIDSQILDISVARTTVNVPNGQTIVIGGMITKSDETVERKVPWLGDLPVVGKAFRYDSTNTFRTELLIFLTPRIIYSDADAELIKQIESERLHFIESEAEELHGPLYSVPAGRQAGLQHVVPQHDERVPETPIEDPEFQTDSQTNAPEAATATRSRAEPVRQASRQIHRPPIRQASAQDNSAQSRVRRADLPDESRQSWMNRILNRKKPTRRRQDRTARHSTESAVTGEEAVLTVDFDSPDWSDMADEDSR